MKSNKDMAIELTRTAMAALREGAIELHAELVVEASMCVMRAVAEEDSQPSDEAMAALRRELGNSVRQIRDAYHALDRQPTESLLDAARRVIKERDDAFSELAQRQSDDEATAQALGVLSLQLGEILGVRDGESVLEAAKRVASVANRRLAGTGTVTLDVNALHRHAGG